MSSLFITEIYNSIQGESSWTGLPCTFIRLAGCNLRCRWCDTSYSFAQGKKTSIAEILQKTKEIGCPLVEITGGEPLLQKESITLMEQLIENGYKVLLETGGSISILEVPKKVHIIMDLKCPGSGMNNKNNLENLAKLTKKDEIKFVISNRQDFEWTKKTILEHNLDKKSQILLSPAWGLVDPKNLVEWILKDKLKCRLNLQTHKYIWSPRAKGV
jgi:7-carboxy-7-deazaguanine synthase